MGVFSTVMSELACAACDARFRDGVQFKTGDDSYMPCYENDFPVPLPPGSTYDGIANAYCPACVVRWCIDDRAVQLDTFADLLETGTIAAFAGTHRAEPPDYVRVLRIHRDTPLTPDEVRARGRIALPRNWRTSLPGHLGDIVFFRDGELADWLSASEMQAHITRVRERMAALGWPVDDFRDLPVTVDATGRIRVG